ncbi:hypothetical protein BLA14095_03716 [Burkholderia lata]|uniref:hypothetical protein n=1 Tax=Burkholderia lata (strain ATCC 17760 / DSM 23089 / LMG 22485 / NCIMB 9086 / R18194 / 383) TaxID=482957 RepID=UPI0014543C9B|nr:hypothetical protein [Burkholderia lata]VWB80494.1 hypothetical protein BLA14095_03716 [Burkholderia lata]
MAEIDNRESAARDICGAVQALSDLWKILEGSLGSDREGAACAMAIELLPLIGGRIDSAISALGVGATGCFEKVLADRGIVISASGTPREEVNHV